MTRESFHGRFVSTGAATAAGGASRSGCETAASSSCTSWDRLQPANFGTVVLRGKSVSTGDEFEVYSEVDMNICRRNESTKEFATVATMVLLGKPVGKIT